MNIKWGVASAALAIGIGAAAAASATTYVYQGNPFAEVSDAALGTAITVDVTLDTAANYTGDVSLGDVVAISMSTGPVTLSGADVFGFGMHLDDGLVQTWAIQSEGFPSSFPQMLTEFTGTSFGESVVGIVSGAEVANGSGFTLGVGGTPGVWNLQAAVPEPATWAMMLMGFGAVGLAVRRRAPRMLAGA